MRESYFSYDESALGRNCFWIWKGEKSSWLKWVEVQLFLAFSRYRQLIWNICASCMEKIGYFLIAPLHPSSSKCSFGNTHKFLSIYIRMQGMIREGYGDSIFIWVSSSVISDVPYHSELDFFSLNFILKADVELKSLFNFSCLMFLALSFELLNLLTTLLGSLFDLISQASGIRRLIISEVQSVVLLKSLEKDFPCGREYCLHVRAEPLDCIPSSAFSHSLILVT